MLAPAPDLLQELAGRAAGGGGVVAHRPLPQRLLLARVLVREADRRVGGAAPPRLRRQPRAGGLLHLAEAGVKRIGPERRPPGLHLPTPRGGRSVGGAGTRARRRSVTPH